MRLATEEARRPFDLERGALWSATVYRLDLTSGKRQLVAKVAPVDPAGVTSISNVLYTPDGKAYAYSDTQELSELFLVAGVR